MKNSVSESWSFRKVYDSVSIILLQWSYYWAYQVSFWIWVSQLREAKRMTSQRLSSTESQTAILFVSLSITVQADDQQKESSYLLYTVSSHS